MSTTTPKSSRGADAAAGSRFTIEDAGSTTEASDLFDNDTTAGGSDSASRSTGSAAADSSAADSSAAVAAAGAASGPGTQAQPVTDEPQRPAHSAESSDRPAAVAATPWQSEAETAAESSEAVPAAASTRSESPSTGKVPPVDDESIAHVFDQTNGVIEAADGDSDARDEE